MTLQQALGHHLRFNKQECSIGVPATCTTTWVKLHKSKAVGYVLKHKIKQTKIHLVCCNKCSTYCSFSYKQRKNSNFSWTSCFFNEVSATNQILLTSTAHEWKCMRGIVWANKTETICIANTAASKWGIENSGVCKVGELCVNICLSFQPSGIDSQESNISCFPINASVLIIWASLHLFSPLMMQNLTSTSI